MTIKLRRLSFNDESFEHSHIDGRPLETIDEDTLLAAEPDLTGLTPSVGIATVLYKWCPAALCALLDLRSWFSLTWNLTVHQGEPEELKFEISRIRSQITIGKLDKEGCWELMVTYNVQEDHELPDGGGIWLPNADETMVYEKNIHDLAEIQTLGQAFVQDLVARKAWLTGRKMKHEFFVEPIGAPVDAFGDGIAMDPHWLYRSLDLSKCSICGQEQHLSRCGKCGTAAYCSSSCQRQDWPVHKAVCTMSAEDRGKALHLSQDGGLVDFNWSGEAGSDETSIDGDDDDSAKDRD